MILYSAATAIGAIMGGHPTSLWQVLSEKPQPLAWNTIFGECGERGEYMDSYSVQAMIQRCQEDYQWTADFESNKSLLSERAEMMSHLYDNEPLWEHTSMVAFADHYIVDDPDSDSSSISRKPYETFLKHKKMMPQEQPIFGGVVMRDWETPNDDQGIQQTLSTFQKNDIDYIRLECNLGTEQDIGKPEKVASNLAIRDRLQCLANVARACQDQEMVPVILLQFPWRDSDISLPYFEHVVMAFATALQTEGVDPEKIMFETRPPIGMTAQEERGLSGAERISLGLEIGETMFEIMMKAFADHPIAGFCVAGGSTKGAMPTAMEDDTQNAVRQGTRMSARQAWGYDLCFWEMGAKLMLQPKVGRLWNHNKSGPASGCDAARELFCLNAKDLADEIRTELV